jgi:hypothetical protein
MTIWYVEFDKSLAYRLSKNLSCAFTEKEKAFQYFDNEIAKLSCKYHQVPDKQVTAPFEELSEYTIILQSEHWFFDTYTVRIYPISLN